MQINKMHVDVLGQSWLGPVVVHTTSQKCKEKQKQETSKCFFLLIPTKNLVKMFLKVVATTLQNYFAF